MNEKSKIKPPVWFWIVSVVAFIWNGMGVNMYLQQAYQTDWFKANYTAEILEMVNNTPSWVTAAYAIAVFTGLLGSIGLLLRKKWAKSLFLVSLIGAVLSNIYHILMSRAIELLGSEALVMPILVIVIGIFFIWFSNKGMSKKWLL